MDLYGNLKYGTVFQTCSVIIDKPMVSLVNGFCGKTYTSLSSTFNVFKIANVVNYRLRFVDLVSGQVSQAIKPQTPAGSYGQIIFGLSELLPVLNYNRNYRVEIATSYLDTLGNEVYGPDQICNVSVGKPVVPTVSGYCEKTYPTLSGIFSVFKIPNVINYKFIFTDEVSPFTATQIIVPQSAPGSYGQISININNAALGLQMNHSYDVEVYAEYYDVAAGSNLYGNVFSNCRIVIGAVAKKGNDELEINTLTVYPNPSNGLYTLSGSQNFTNASIKIYNSLSQIVFEKENINGNNINLDISSVTSGMYLLEFEQDKEISRMKLIKE